MAAKSLELSTRHTVCMGTVRERSQEFSQLRFNGMTVDEARAVVEYLPPEMLSIMRFASPEFRNMVDSYVLNLVEIGEFQDPEGRDLRFLEYPYQPSEILENWEYNEFTRNVAPLSVEE